MISFYVILEQNCGPLCIPEIFQYLDLPLDLLLLDGLEGLDHALLVVGHVDRLENLAILSAAQLAD